MLKEFAQEYKDRSYNARSVETFLGTIVLLSGVGGALFLDLNTTLSTIMIGTGALFVSKTRTLEALSLIKDNLPWSK